MIVVIAAAHRDARLMMMRSHVEGETATETEITTIHLPATEREIHQASSMARNQYQQYDEAKQIATDLQDAETTTMMTTQMTTAGARPGDAATMTIVADAKTMMTMTGRSMTAIAIAIEIGDDEMTEIETTGAATSLATDLGEDTTTTIAITMIVGIEIGTVEEGGVVLRRKKSRSGIMILVR